MNIQNMIRSYKEWGFSRSEIVKRIDLDYVDIKYVDNALNSYPDGYKSYGFEPSRVGERAGNKRLEWPELLWKHGPDFMNNGIKKHGTQGFANELGVKRHVIYNMRRFFGLNSELPHDALNYLGYVPVKIRKEIDKVDNRTCIRCNNKRVHKRLDYHIINTDKLPSVDNVVTLCDYCHKYYIHAWCEGQRGINFKGFDRKKLEKFIKHYYNISKEYFQTRYTRNELEKLNFIE